MYRQLYQLGGSPTGIATMPMDYGQSLQVNNQVQGQEPLMLQAPNYSSATSITTNPLLNYGQPQLGQAGGTPLTMRNGGMSRLGYQEGGMSMDQMMPQESMMQPQAQQMDPKQALELIIQMLIEQGIPPEQAREIAIQMVQAVAEGGMEEMSDERVEARFGGRIGYAGGGIGSLVGRQGYFLGSVGKAISGVVKGAGKLVSGAVKAVKKVASSDLGKAALTVAAIYAAGGGFGLSPEGFTLFGTPGSTAGGLLGAGGEFGLGQSFLGQSLLGTAGAAPTQGLFGAAGVFKPSVGSLIPTGISSLLPSSSTLTTLGLGTALGGVLGGAPKREDFGSDEEYEQAVAQWKSTLQSRLDQPNPQFAGGLFPNNPFYPQRAANGGRIGYQMGGIGDLISQVTKQEFFGRPAMAMGGEIPVRENQAGITELDYRQTGGFVPPIGIKEKADDIPAMLSNNEFVFTADAVRNAGGGNVNKGAERMYSLMKNLEAGGRV
jgi:hypothetical protein